MSTEPDYIDLERDYWRSRLLGALSVERERRAVVAVFREMTAHAEPAPFVFDPETRCMRNLRARIPELPPVPLSTAGGWR